MCVFCIKEDMKQRILHVDYMATTAGHSNGYIPFQDGNWVQYYLIGVIRKVIKYFQMESIRIEQFFQTTTPPHQLRWINIYPKERGH